MNTILNAIQLPVILLNDVCAIKNVNHVFSTRFGHTTKDLENEHFEIIFSEQSVSEIEAYLEHTPLSSNEITDRLSVHIKNKDDTWDIAVISLHRLSLPDLNSPIILIQILSTEKIATTSKAEDFSTNIYRELLENLPGATYLCKNDSNYSVLYIGSKIADILGYTPKEFKDEEITLASLIPANELATIRSKVDIALNNREAFHLTYPMEHRNGNQVWVDETGKGIYNKNGELLFIMGYYTAIKRSADPVDR